MKQNKLWKVLGIAFLALVVLSWIIPAATYATGAFKLGVISPIGFFDLIRLPLATISNYVTYGIFLLVLGGLYGVMNATGVYATLLNSLVTAFKKKETMFLIVTTVGFALFSAITGLTFVLFILVPLFVSALLLMNYNKITALAATVGAILVGGFSSIYGYKVSVFINYLFNIGANQYVLVKIALLIVSVVLLVIFMLNANKKAKAEKLTDIPLYDKTEEKKKSMVPLIALLSLTVILLLVGLYNWTYGASTTFFETLYTNMTSFKIAGFPIIKNLMGVINPLGWWGIEEITMILILLSIVLGWVYNLKIKETIKSFIKGAQEMAVPAFYVVLANILMAFIANGQSDSNLYNTIAHFFLTMSGGFNIVTTAIVALFGGLFYNDVSYVLNTMSSNIMKVVTDTTMYPVIGLIFQTVHGLLMLVLPTSLMLIAGLSYLKVSYLDWIKYIWLYVLQLLAVAAVVIVVMSLLV